MRRRPKIEECKRCGVILTPSGSCPGINCPTHNETTERRLNCKMCGRVLTKEEAGAYTKVAEDSASTEFVKIICGKCKKRDFL